MTKGSKALAKINAAHARALRYAAPAKMAKLIVIEENGKVRTYRMPLAAAIAKRDALNKPGHTVATVIG